VYFRAAYLVVCTNDRPDRNAIEPPQRSTPPISTVPRLAIMKRIDEEGRMDTRKEVNVRSRATSCH
jgi:hypothetical protein